MLVAVFNGLGKKASRGKGEARVEIHVYVDHLTARTGSGVTRGTFLVETTYVFTYR